MSDHSYALIVLLAVMPILGCHQGEQTHLATDTSIEEQNEATHLSLRWKKEHNIEDFYKIKDAYLKPGVSSITVTGLLGEPLSKSKTNDGAEHWLFIRCDAQKEQYDSWTCVINNGKVIEWTKKGIE